MNEYNFLHIICNGCLAKVQVQGNDVVSKYRSSHHNNFSWTFGNIRNASNWVGALLLWKIQLEGIHIVIEKKVPAHLAAPTYVVSCKSSFCLLLIPATSLHVFKKASNSCMHSINYELYSALLIWINHHKRPRTSISIWTEESYCEFSGIIDKIQNKIQLQSFCFKKKALHM